MRRVLLRVPALILVLGCAARIAGAGELELRKGDRICLLGNALAERMQHDGWLEALLHSRFPGHELVIRNLGFAADELTIRQRVDGFGTPNDWLTRCKADVIFAFFGFNESFAGEAGVAKFRQDLDAFIKGTLAQKYNGQSAPRLVLFSPIAAENLKTRDLPDGKAINARLQLYAQAMFEVAQAQGVQCIDLLSASEELYNDANEALTMNGIHLTDAGNQRLAGAIDAKLFGARKIDFASLEKLRQAILEKNFPWFNRYRPTDDYNIFGGRSDLKYTDNLSNREVLMREMEILEVQTANRDKRVWAAARGQDVKVDDTNTPPHIPVKTNRPGPNPDGSYQFLSGEAAIEKMTIAEGLKVNLFASEEKFPELANPVQMAFDTKGRMWVAAWPTYPHWKPQTPMNDKLLILEDTDGDGKADSCKVFADDLHDPTGFEFYNGGVIVASAPDLIYMKDTDGDDRADVRLRILHGISSGDTHHAANSFALDPGGALYFGEGVFHRTQTESPYGPVRNTDACFWRFEPRTWRIERYVAHGFANPHGNVFDYWGNNFIHDGTGANPYHAALFSGHIDEPHKHPTPPTLYKQRTRPCPGTEILSSRHFPDEMQNELLVGNVIGFQGILRYKIAPEGASFAGTEIQPPLLSSSDPNFRPSDFEVGPDGAFYFTDWQKPLIGHMQHHIRDPNRDQVHGRVYRVTYPARPLLKPAKIAGESIKKLLDLLKEPEHRTRFRARLELSAHPADKVAAAAAKWSRDLDKKDPNYEHHMMEALWIHQFQNVPNEELLKRMLRSPDGNARAAATRVLCAWREVVPEPLALLRVQAEDDFPLVRLETVRACSFFRTAEAADVALLVLKQPMDQYLSYTFGETMRQLEPFWTAALSKGETLARGNPRGAAYILEKVQTPDLLKMERNEAVFAAMLSRHGIPEKNRLEALEGLAKHNKTDVMTELLAAMERAETSGGGHAAHILDDLGHILLARPDEIAAAAARIKQLAAGARTSSLRAIAFAAWIVADKSDEAAYAAASQSVASLTDYLLAAQFIADEKLRGAMYPRVRPLMFTLPDNLAAERKNAVAGQQGLRVAFHQFSPPNAALETFENRKPEAAGIAQKISIDIPQVLRRDQFALVFTGTLYVPQPGKYTLYITSDDGSRLYLDNKLLIDNDGLHGMVTKSQTADLSAGVHSIAVTYFDAGGGDGLKVEWKGPGIEHQEIPATALGTGGVTIHDEAIRAMSRLPGHETERFSDFAKLISDPQRRTTAVTAMRSIPKQHWPADQTPRVVDAVLAYLTSLPASERTSTAAIDALNLGKELAAALPKEQAEQLGKRLQTLNVDIVLIRPIPHQMMFDHKRFAVEAGKPVEIIFENTDVMPHNLVITAPGAMTEVGQLAEQMGAAGDAKQYIPDSPKVLWHTKLVLPGKSERLTFTAPKELGEYAFVCTFPGHYLVMNGVMDVVKDKSTAKAAEVTVHVDAPQRPFVKMWELKDLEADAAQLGQGRSLQRGKEMFTTAGCIKCHVLKGEGSKIGPDLSEVTKKYKGAALLKQVIEPSTEINEQYRTFLIATKDGKRLSGLVMKEDDQNVEVLTNPLDPQSITKLPKGDVASKKPLPLSSMPTGLLVTLNKDEILDLLAFIEAGGAVDKK